MSHTKMATLTVILSELFPLDHFRYNFMSALYLEYPLEYNHDTYSYVEQVMMICRVQE